MKKLIGTLTVLTLVSQTSSAFFFSEKMVQDKTRLIKEGLMKKSSTKMLKLEESSCRDFSGHWKGQCKSTDPGGDSTNESQLVIEQTKCFSLKVKSKFMDGTQIEKTITIGAINSSVISAFMGLHSVDFSNWSDDRSTLNLKNRFFFNVVFGETSLVKEFEGGILAYIENDKLIVKSSFADSNTECIHDRLK